MKDSTNPTEVLCMHAARTLPDSISERKHVLRALEKLVKGKAAEEVRAQLAAIAAIEVLQVELPLVFSQGMEGGK